MRVIVRPIGARHSVKQLNNSSRNYSRLYALPNHTGSITQSILKTIIET